MANTDNTITMIAGGTITEFALVSLDAAGKCVVTTAATDAKVIGVAQRAVAAGEAVDVIVNGIKQAQLVTVNRSLFSSLGHKT
jgi:hypothetical protein